MQPVLPGMDLSKVGTHTQLNIAELKDPGIDFFYFNLRSINL